MSLRGTTGVTVMINKKRIKKILRMYGEREAVDQSQELREAARDIVIAHRLLGEVKERLIGHSITGCVTSEDIAYLQNASNCVAALSVKSHNDATALKPTTAVSEIAKSNLDYASDNAYVIGHNEISFTTEPITFDDIELGPFRVSVDIETEEAKAVALEPNHPVQDDSVTHPNIMNGKICMGDGLHSFERCIRNKLYFAALDIAVSIVRTNGSSSPYVSIENWNGSPCQSCGDSTDDYCTSCEEACCNDCLMATEDDYTSCPDCQPPECEVCGDRRDGGDCQARGCYRHVCNSCEDDSPYCNEHAPTCVDCGTKSNLNHCESCENKMCSDCVQGCEECRQACLCSECTFSCSSCDSVRCIESCQNKCEECDTHVCNDCIGKCEACGLNTDTCAACLEEFNNRCEDCKEENKECTTTQTTDQSPILAQLEDWSISSPIQALVETTEALLPTP